MDQKTLNSGTLLPMEKTSGFYSLQISDEILRALDLMGFEEPSPIQVQAIPYLIEGRDLVGQAQTGTGKTAAYAIPLLQRLKPDVRGIQVLILTPTRELAIQVAEEIGKIGKFLRVRELAIFGGQPIERQIRALRAGVSVVAGTPGRLLDHIERGTLRLDHVSAVVLDEADEMLDMGFIDDIERILAHTPTNRQTVCFSATMPSAILSLSQRYMRDAVRVRVTPDHLTAPSVIQYYLEVRPFERTDALVRVIDIDEINRAIIFCRTKRGVDELTAALQARGYLAEAIHGDLTQPQRQRVLQQFREGNVELLVATDVAARGLDIENISHVINFDIAASPEDYVHRIGRTGRAGRTGTAYTFVHPREMKQLRQIERVTNKRILRRPVPSRAELLNKQRNDLRQRLEALVEAGVGGESLDIAGELLDRYDSQDLLAAAIHLALDSMRGTELNRPDNDAPPSHGSGYATSSEPGMTRLFANIGRSSGVTPADFVRSIAIEAEIPGKSVGAIDIRDHFSFVEVPSEFADRVLEAMDGVTLRGRIIRFELSRPRGR